MAAIGESANDILTTPHDPLQRMLTQLFVNIEGDQDITQQTGQTVTATQAPTGVYLLQPPQDQTDIEWILESLQLKDTANIDVNDRAGFAFIDIVSNYVLHFFDMTANQNDSIRQNTWIWPWNIAATTSGPKDVCQEYRPFRLFRRRSGESWRRVRVDYIATATVGTRTLELTALYRRRPLTRI